MRSALSNLSILILSLYDNQMLQLVTSPFIRLMQSWFWYFRSVDKWLAAVSVVYWIFVEILWNIFLSKKVEFFFLFRIKRGFVGKCLNDGKFSKTFFFNTKRSLQLLLYRTHWFINCCWWLSKIVIIESYE